ncbi:MAG: hypothetical protein IH571_03670 [Acholeplasmataceae bacterium]|nr:hypothetical protein [Acholeplasmataceae bacterium]
MNHANAVITASRVVIQDSEIKGKIAGAIVGYYKLGSVSVTDALVDVDFTFASPTTGAIGIADLAAITLTNAYADLTGNVSGGSAVQFTEGYSIDTTSINVEWWETNISSIHGSSLWTWHEASSFFILER